MIRRPLVIEAGMAILLAAVLIVASPGLAVVGVVALLVLAICGATLVIERRQARRR